MASCMAKVGRLNVKAPSGTSVWVDGVAAQWVEGEPIDVSPGAHDVQLKNAIGAKTRKVDAPAGQVTFVEWEDPTGVVPVTNNPTNPNPTPTTTNPTTASGEPVEAFALMLAEGGGKPFERREAGAHCHRRPAVEELPTPDARVVGPEVLELFLPQVPPNRAQVDSDQVAESSPLEKGEVLGILGPQHDGAPSESPDAGGLLSRQAVLPLRARSRESGHVTQRGRMLSCVLLEHPETQETQQGEPLPVWRAAARRRARGARAGTVASVRGRRR